MIVVATNRNLNPAATDHTVFGDMPNEKGLDELRIATAEFKGTGKNKRWNVEVLPEKSADVSAGNPPSRELFARILQDIVDGKLSGDWVLLVHGFNQSFEKNLVKCRHIETIYGVNVLAFSWPSNQGGFKPDEYKKARAAARGSTNAFDRLLEKLGEYLAVRPFAADCQIRVSLMAYSLGSFLFENFVRPPVFSSETKIFDNIVLTQADVDVDRHAEWVNRLVYGRRVYVTINEDDSVLRWSDKVNPPRLGNTARNLGAHGAVYFDFTNGEGVGSTHGLFYKTAKKNVVVKSIFKQALTGRRAEDVPGIIYNEDSNAYELLEQSDPGIEIPEGGG